MAAAEAAPPNKRQRHDNHESLAVSLYNPSPGAADHDPHFNIRTSSLASSTMKMTGHKGSVYCLDYDPNGEVLCSGSFDSTCLLWNGEYLAASKHPCLTEI